MIKEFMLKWIGDISYDQYLSLIVDLLGKSVWPLTVVVFLILFRKNISGLIARIRSVEQGDKKLVFDPPGGETSETELNKMASSRQTDSNRIIADLAFLVYKYQYVWSAWTTRQEFSHAVRFSESYSGGRLRYIDEYVHDLDEFQQKYSTVIPENIKTPLDKLLSYLKEVRVYHDTNEKLSAPAFSAPKYLALFGDLIKATGKSGRPQ
jgi:hypothetical protein